MGGAVATFTDIYAKVVLIFILMVNTLTSPKRIERLTFLLVVASGYIAARSVIDYIRGINLIEYGRVLGSVGGMFRNPNDLALNMVVVLPLAWCSCCGRFPCSAGWSCLPARAAMMGAIVASQSRSGTLGLAAMIAVAGFQLLRRQPGLVAAGTLAALIALPLLPSVVLASHGEHHRRQPRRVRLARSAFDADGRGLECVPRGSAHRRRRRPVRELQP